MAPKCTLLFLLFFGIMLFPVLGQEKKILLTGKIFSGDQQPLSGVNIRVKNSTKGTFSDREGNFKLYVQFPEDSILVFSILNYKNLNYPIASNKGNVLKIEMEPTSLNLTEIEVKKQRNTSPGSVHIDPIFAKNLSNAGSGAIEQLVKTLPGVSSHNELTPQYNVRGGNYDENLLYVNGIEIFRPFLVKTGEQEGLSFLNPDLVSKIRFSPGGFESSYGDKMSSVLDIDYKVPGRTGGTAEVGALGASVHLEGRALHDHFSYLTGIRYRDNRYLLGTLDQKGHYDPSCFDLQALLGYHFSPKFSLDFLTNVASNNYSFSPGTRETRYGTMSQAYLLKIYFEGKEKDQFTNRMGALTANYRPNENLQLTWTMSSFISDEKERYDILGQYYLNEIFSGSGFESNPDSSLLLGVGSSLRHAGNYLKATISSIEQSGQYKINKHKINWGLKYQSERIHDQVNEWEMRDSAGYSLPYNNKSVELYHSTKADLHLNTNRYSAYIQDLYTTQFDNSVLILNVGGRMQYWDFNGQAIVSPRISAIYLPDKLKQLQFHAAWGIYQQMPFFKELLNREAILISTVKAQKSVHYLLGLDRSFQWGDRPFKFTTEVWYKRLTHLIPYKVNNLDLQYFPEQQSKGYASGLELKIFGEPIPGATSWASVTFMKTEEDIDGDKYIKKGTSEVVFPGYLYRPSDQRFNFSLFFQDYLPKNPTVKMNLTLLYGSSMPFGPPQGERWMDSFRMPAYKRVDIGFSKMLVGEEATRHSNFFTDKLKEAWLSLEIFNLFDLDNTISYYWVSDFENQMHAVPNYLTGRRINMKVSVSF